MQLVFVPTCPYCQRQAIETMPRKACQFFYNCAGCGKRLKPLPGDCCVFCSFGTVLCPRSKRAVRTLAAASESRGRSFRVSAGSLVTKRTLIARSPLRRHDGEKFGHTCLEQSSVVSALTVCGAASSALTPVASRREAMTAGRTCFILRLV